MSAAGITAVLGALMFWPVVCFAIFRKPPGYRG